MKITRERAEQQFLDVLSYIVDTKGYENSMIKQDNLDLIEELELLMGKTQQLIKVLENA